MVWWWGVFGFAVYVPVFIRAGMGCYSHGGLRMWALDFSSCHMLDFFTVLLVADSYWFRFVLI